MRYVIIGGCIAACGAVEGIRSKDADGQIIIIDGEKRGAYTRPLISYFLSEPDKYSDIDYRSPEFFKDQRVEVIKARVESIDRAGQLLDLDSGEQIEYDRLLIATGASPIMPPIPGADQDWVKSFYTIGDSESINRDIEAVREAVVIGSGLIGMKAAEALYKRGLKVHLIEKESHILPRQLNPGSAVFVYRHLARKGLDIITGAEVAVIHPDHQIELKSGQKISADLVIMAVGTRPNVELAVKAGLKVKLGIVLDDHLRTSDDRIYAAGDAAETLNVISGKPEVMALLPHAHREGYQAGRNMTGMDEHDQGSIPMNSVKLLGWNICSAGTPGDKNGELLTWHDNDRLLELKVRDNYLIGYIAVNMPEVAGPLTNATAKKISAAAGGWQVFVERGPALATIPAAYWQELRRLEANGSN
ncbi:nitrite reductase putative subunit [hydrocarbon metagenome]|uniref:Nitrite reductase putative subunit n=1 Tax=hydrocarbon metagenome TaxID=938273 RepID=A0A0W8E6Z9_9ZZZZ